MPVHVLVEQVTEPPGPTGVTRLGAKSAEPHVVPGLDLDPVLIEPVDGLALKNIKPVLNDVGLRERNRRARLESDDGNVHVVPDV